MLSSIHPLGERGRNSRWALTVSAHIVGATLGGATTGAVAGLLGWSIRAIVDGRLALGLGAVVAAAAALHELGVVRLRLPSWSRQVNEDWLTTYRGWVYGVGFGFQLGSGVVTIITSPATHVVLVLAALTGSPLAGALVGAAYGAARGATILAGRRITTPERLVGFHRGMAAGAAPVRRLAGAVLFAVGLVAATAALA